MKWLWKFLPIAEGETRAGKFIALSFGQLLTQIVALVTVAILARVLSFEDYATYRQVFVAYAFAAPLLTLALPEALYWFLPRYKGQERTVLVENLVMLVLAGAFFAAFLAIGGTRLLAVRFHNPDLENALLMLVPYPLLTFPAGAVGACLVVQNCIKSLTIFNVLSRLLLGALVILCAFLWPHPAMLVAVNVLVAAVTCGFAVWLMFSACPGILGSLDRGRMAEMLQYSVPLGLATMLSTITLQLDKIIVSALCSPKDFAIYSNGAVELPLVGIVTGTLSTIILADMARMCADHQPKAALELFHQAAIRSSALLMPAMVFLFVAAEPFIQLIFSAKYDQSVLPFRAYLFILPMRIIFYGVALKAMGRTRDILYRSLCEVALDAVLCILLVNWIGYLGAVIAILITLYGFSFPYNLSAVAKGFGVTRWEVLPFRRIFAILLLSIVGAPVYFLLPLIHAWPPLLQLAILAAVYWPLVLGLIYKFKFVPASSTF